MNMNVVGILELESIADGLLVLDAMVKTAPVSILKAESINPGKFFIIVSGDIASVEYAVERGVEIGKKSMIDHLFLKNIDSRIIDALLKKTPQHSSESLGVLETRSLTTCIEAADMAVKAADVRVLDIMAGNELGGKAVVTFSGVLGDLEDAMNIAVSFAQEKGQLYRHVLIPGPHIDMRGFVYGN